MASSDNELELLLMEAGNKLLEPPSSTDELITILDQIESFLSRVEQSPGQSMHDAISPSLKALIGEQLFRHPDNDVKVAVAACISEITRITAPEAPYEDDQMKEVFQLIVSSFKNLSDKSSRSYIKRTSILETVAKVRSCVVMLDLECDSLIIQMFEHFLNAIRDYHADTVFTSMVTIMTLVLEESEDISMEMLSPILATVKRDNEDVLPIARRLAKSVLQNCASRLKPYLMQAVEKSGIPLEDYSTVVGSICQVMPNAVGQNDAAADKHVDDESKGAEPPLDIAQEDIEIPKESVLTEHVGLANEKSLASDVSNGIVQTGENDSLDDSNFLKKQEEDRRADKSPKADKSTVAEPDGLKGEKVVDSDSKLEKSSKKKGRKSRSKSTEPSDSTHDDENKVETLIEHKDDSKNDAHPPCEDPSVAGAVPAENKRERDVQPTVTKATEDESNVVISSKPGRTVHDEHSERVARPKKKDGLSKKTIRSVDDVSKKSSEVRSDSEAKSNKRSGKKVSSKVSVKDSDPSDVDKSKKESGAASDSDAKPLKQLLKKVDSISDNADGTSSRKLEDKKRRARGKVIPKKDGTKISTKNDDEETVGSPKAVKPNKQDSHMEKTPKTNSKRKHTPSKEKASDALEYGENLLGVRVKVWWPMDEVFYEGVIQSFDSANKKHKVWYDDGDLENLDLKNEKWEVIKNEPRAYEDDATDNESADGSSEIISLKKKAKRAGRRSKKASVKSSSKRGGASSGKSKGTATKSGHKAKEDGKVDDSKSASKSGNIIKAKEHTPKSGGRLDEVASKIGNKSKNEETTSEIPKSTKSKNEETSETPKSTKSKNEETSEIPKATKSKDDDGVTPKASTKSKEDTSKTAKSKKETLKVSSNSKGKPRKSGGKSDANGTVKPKSGSSKPKDSESMKENSTSSAEVVETAKRKAPSSSKGKGSDSKRAKKLKATSTDLS